MINNDLSPAHQDYLKAIYMLVSRGQKATNSALAQALAVAPASATNMVKRLAEAGLIEHSPYQGIRLTPRGEQAALEMVRHHRLIELFLHDILDMPWDQVHAEAERLEHAISEEVEEAIARKLGYPAFDPHGDPIPDREGRWVDNAAGLPLTELPLYCPAQLVRVHAQDGDRLRYLGELGLYPGATVTVRERAPFAGPLSLVVNGADCVLAHELAQALVVAQEERG